MCILFDETYRIQMSQLSVRSKNAMEISFCSWSLAVIKRKKNKSSSHENVNVAHLYFLLFPLLSGLSL